MELIIVYSGFIDLILYICPLILKRKSKHVTTNSSGEPKPEANQPYC